MHSVRKYYDAKGKLDHEILMDYTFLALLNGWFRLYSQSAFKSVSITDLCSVDMNILPPKIGALQTGNHNQKYFLLKNG
jgi:hypothetical protein